jgi:hypothetical protein
MEYYRVMSHFTCVLKTYFCLIQKSRDSSGPERISLLEIGIPKKYFTGIGMGLGLVRAEHGRDRDEKPPAPRTLFPCILIVMINHLALNYW